jgi:hypothetical protein
MSTRILISPSACFNADITTDEIFLDNDQTAEILIATGAGTAEPTTAKVIAANENGDEKVLEEREITIGTNAVAKFKVSADKLANKNLDRIYLFVLNASNTTIRGCIFAVVNNARYSYDE